MQVENNPDFKSVWQLALDWAGIQLDHADSVMITEEVRLSIDRLMRAISNREISGRWNGYRIFMNDSFMISIFEIRHIARFFLWFRFNKFNREYLDKLYVRRNEVINWCEKVALVMPPPCWSESYSRLTHNSQGKITEADEENKNWYAELTERRRNITVCLEIAKNLWKENPELTYEQIFKHPIMLKYGNPSVFSFESFKKWAKEHASDYAQKGGRRK